MAAVAETIIESAVEHIDQKALTVAEQAKQIIVRDAATYTLACDTLRGVVSMRKQVAETFGPMKDAAHKAHKAVTEQERKVDTPLAEAERFLKVGIGQYQAEQERIRRAEEARLQEEARQAEEERARKEAEDIALQDAIEAEQNGDTKGAEAILAHPVPIAPAYVAPVVLARTVQKQEGISGRKNWKFRVTNEALIPREYLKIDDQKIGQVVRAMKQMTKIPGIEVFAEDSVAVKL